MSKPTPTQEETEETVMTEAETVTAAEVQAPSTTPSTPHDRPPSPEYEPLKEPQPKPLSMEELLVNLTSLLQASGPLMEFHKKSEEASEDDLRIYWDVRIVRGAGTPYLSTKGQASLPGALSGSSVVTAPAAVHREITDKIAAPLHGRIQDMLNKRNLDKLADDAAKIAANAANAAKRNDNTPKLMAPAPAERDITQSEQVMSSVALFAPPGS